MLKRASVCLVSTMALAVVLHAQDTATSKQGLEHILGTLTAVDATTHTVTVKEDKTATSYTILVADTKTLLKVEPGAKDLKNAVRITADDLQVGDRVDVRGSKSGDNPNALAARSVVLMSGRALQQAHQAEAAEWQHSTAGMVTSVDPASGKIGATVKSAEGPKTVAIETTSQTEFTRYAPENPKTPAVSQLAQIQVGDQIRVIGDKSADGAAVSGTKSLFRRVPYDFGHHHLDRLRWKIRYGEGSGEQEGDRDFARRRDARAQASTHDGDDAGAPIQSQLQAGGGRPRPEALDRGEPGNAGATWAMRSAPGERGPRMGGGGGSRGNGDISMLLERAPKIALSDLKQGDAVVISGVATGADNTRLMATNVIAGVEPILQSAPQRQGGQNLGGDWGLGEISAPQ